MPAHCPVDTSPLLGFTTCAFSCIADVGRYSRPEKINRNTGDIPQCSHPPQSRCVFYIHKNIAGNGVSVLKYRFSASFYSLRNNK